MIALAERSGLLALSERALGCGGVIAYHGITRDPFLPSVHVTIAELESQLEFVASNYRVIPLTEFVGRRRQGRSLRRCVAITFDDAYTGVLELALPVLERLQVPATVFVATRHAASGGRYWWDRVAWITECGDVPQVAAVLRTITVTRQPTSADILGAIVARGGRLGAETERELALAEQRTGVVPLHAMNPLELRQLAHSELIEFGCHTESHPSLPGIPQAEQVAEITESYRWLQDHLPRARPILAYPYGLYDRRSAESARLAGMEAAFSIEGRAAGPRFELHTCPRIGMAGVNNIRGLRVRLNWSAIPAVAWRNGGWHPRLPTTAQPA